MGRARRLAPADHVLAPATAPASCPPRTGPTRPGWRCIHTGDNHGPPTPEEVKKLLDEAAQKLPGVKVRIGRLSDFADAILAEKAEICRSSAATCRTPGFTGRCRDPGRREARPQPPAR